MSAEPFFYFVVLLFLVPFLTLSTYAWVIYRFLSRIRSKIRILVPPVLAVFLATLVTFSTSLPLSHASLLGSIFVFIYATEVAMGVITPVPIFEGRTTEKQRKYMVLLFSVILAILFMRGFASAIGTPAPTLGMLGLIDYRDALKLGKAIFHFTSALLPYLEVTLISTAFHAFCYGLIALFSDEKAESV